LAKTTRLGFNWRSRLLREAIMVEQLFDENAERALIGAVMVDPGMLPLPVEPGDFHTESARYAFEAILSLREHGQAIDTVTVEAELRRHNQWDAVGLSFLMRCERELPSSSHAANYAGIVADLARRRSVVGLAERLVKSAVSKNGQFSSDLDRAAKALSSMTTQAKPPATLMTADTILATEWGEPRWAIPGLLPAGLTILAGKPKIGKSWLALQIALSVASGGVALGVKVEAGPVWYIALEDTQRRLKSRMVTQGWTRGLPADFVTIDDYREKIGDLRHGGAEKIAHQIEARDYRFVVVDTLARAMQDGKDQNDMGVMTATLGPIQEAAQRKNCAAVMLDHHGKGFGQVSDVVGDIIGSTAKGAVADCVWGLYRERGTKGAKLSVVGRDMEEKTLALSVDWELGCWQCEGDADQVALTKKCQEITTALDGIGKATCAEIAKAVGRDKGNIYKDLQEMVSKGLIRRGGLFYFLPGS
jgi:hypothetical protein